MSTVGAIALPTPAPADFTGGGGTNKKAIPALQSAALLVNSGPGRLMKILVTVTLATAWTFYDTANTSSQTGADVIAVIPSGATAGQIFDVRMPVKVGIVAVPGASAAGSLEVSFS